jgi:phospholipase D1/2
MSFLFDKVKDAVKDVQAKIEASTTGQPTHSHTHKDNVCSDDDNHHLHRFQSFAPQREGNEVKWYVDACGRLDSFLLLFLLTDRHMPVGYMWAVSVALENAVHSIWILGE